MGRKKVAALSLTAAGIAVMLLFIPTLLQDPRIGRLMRQEEGVLPPDEPAPSTVSTVWDGNIGRDTVITDVVVPFTSVYRVGDENTLLGLRYRIDRAELTQKSADFQKKDYYYDLRYHTDVVMAEDGTVTSPHTLCELTLTLTNIKDKKIRVTLSDMPVERMERVTEGGITGLKSSWDSRGDLMAQALASRCLEDPSRISRSADFEMHPGETLTLQMVMIIPDDWIEDCWLLFVPNRMGKPLWDIYQEGEHMWYVALYPQEAVDSAQGGS